MASAISSSLLSSPIPKFSVTIVFTASLSSADFESLYSVSTFCATALPNSVNAFLTPSFSSGLALLRSTPNGIFIIPFKSNSLFNVPS